jgi:hypothetical protein
MYSAWFVKRPIWGRAPGLLQTTSPRQVQPPAWRASVAAGSCRQSVNTQIGAPGLAIRRHSACQSAHQ